VRGVAAFPSQKGKVLKEEIASREGIDVRKRKGGPKRVHSLGT